MTSRIVGDDRRRLLSKLNIPAEPNACWLFRGAKTGGGYGNIYIDGKYRPAHRVAYELFVGPVPEDLELDHMCHNESDCPGGKDCPHRACCNWGHLQPSTHRENDVRGKSLFAVNAAKTHCDQGHEFTPENTYARKDRKPGNTARECRRCRATNQARYRQRVKLKAAGMYPPAG
ncbi:HNH endonuclease signature motif containing protein [Streptomyces microflavus]|uniref:HNH endonuclease signature motif containing protein n=1 Tax=Streptomyces microflavus TaxID=1919 RepID=UPI002E365246|nr:HNH endonuclease signature motif containing protein [Streptomyces microflavus]